MNNVRTLKKNKIILSSNIKKYTEGWKDIQLFLIYNNIK